MNPDFPLLATNLAVVAWVLIAIYVTSLVGVIFPLRILDPSWQSQLIAALINNAGFPLIGLAIITSIPFILPCSDWVLNHARSLSRLACFAIIGFLLLIPLQGYVVWKTIHTASSERAMEIRKATDKIKTLRSAVQEAATSPQLAQNFNMLGGPQISEEDSQLPLPELKRRLNLILQQAEDQINRVKRSTQEIPIGSLVQNSLRVLAGALAYAVGFSSLAHRKNSPGSVLQDCYEAFQMYRFKKLRRRDQATDDYLQQIQYTNKDESKS